MKNWKIIIKYILIPTICILVATLIYKEGEKSAWNKNLEIGDKFPMKEFVNDLSKIQIKENQKTYYMYRYLSHDPETGNICDITVSINNDSILLKRLEPLLYPENKLEIIFKDTIQYVSKYY